jgi:hypothetical protein
MYLRRRLHSTQAAGRDVHGGHVALPAEARRREKRLGEAGAVKRRAASSLLEAIRGSVRRTLPPGAAHTSATESPGCGSSSATTSPAASS